MSFSMWAPMRLEVPKTLSILQSEIERVGVVSVGYCRVAVAVGTCPIETHRIILQECTRLYPGAPRLAVETWEFSTTNLNPHRLRLPRQQLPQHILQDPAVGVVQGFLRRVDADQGTELDIRLAFHGGPHFYFAAGGEVLDQVADAGDLEHFFSRQFERFRVLARAELQGQDAHADQVRAVNAFVAF